MSLPEANHYLPKERRMSAAYDVANLNNSTLAIGGTVEQIKNAQSARVQVAAIEYMAAGFLYLADRVSDEFIQHVGTAAWRSMQMGLVSIGYTTHPQMAALAYDIPAEMVSCFPPGEAIFATVQMPYENANDDGLYNPRLGEIAIILTPPEFLIRARQQPIMSLAATVYLASQMRDYLNARQLIDNSDLVSDRADALEAHFLNFALKEDPMLPLTDAQLFAMRKFPKGVDSLSPEARYIGNAGLRPFFPHRLN